MRNELELIPVEVSLVVTTIGRAEPLRRLLKSVVGQRFAGVEVIVVDQGGSAEQVVSEFAGQLRIKYLRSQRRGASRGRNEGMAIAQGRIVGFPDDDCWYGDGILRRIFDELNTNTGCAVLVGSSRDENGEYSNSAWGRRNADLDEYTIWDNHIEYTIFVKSHICDRYMFDESIGVGAGTLWGSGEAAEFLMRILRGGHRIRYAPEVAVYHPKTINTIAKAITDADTLERHARYALGWGWTLARACAPKRVVLYYVARPFFIAPVRGVLGRGNWRSDVVIGLARLVGYICGRSK
jgi:glycosyltransferase involved in cell wall biosynthesis